jgi:hypothetical protein
MYFVIYYEKLAQFLSDGYKIKEQGSYLSFGHKGKESIAT